MLAKFAGCVLCINVYLKSIMPILAEVEARENLRFKSLRHRVMFDFNCQHRAEIAPSNPV